VDLSLNENRNLPQYSWMNIHLKLTYAMDDLDNPAPELNSRYVIFRYDKKPRAHLWMKKSLDNHLRMNKSLDEGKPPGALCG
jgi:hypothetical protein